MNNKIKIAIFSVAVVLVAIILSILNISLFKSGLPKNYDPVAQQGEHISQKHETVNATTTIHTLATIPVGYKLSQYFSPQPIFSRDGSKVIYIINDGDYNNFVALNGSIISKQYKMIEDLEVSPDFKTIFYLAEKKDGKMAVVINGQEEKSYEIIYYLTVSPDFKRYAYLAVENNDCIIVVDGKEESTAKKNCQYNFSQRDYIGRSITFSPDGRKIAYIIRSDDNQYAVVVNGKINRFYDELGDPIYDISTPSHYGSPIIFSPDSKHMAYIAYKINASDRKGFVVLDVEEVNRTISSGTEYGRIAHLEFSSDSKKIGWRAVSYSSPEEEIFGLLDIEKRDIIRNYAANNAQYIKFSPDGQKVAFFWDEPSAWATTSAPAVTVLNVNNQDFQTYYLNIECLLSDQTVDQAPTLEYFDFDHASKNVLSLTSNPCNQKNDEVFLHTNDRASYYAQSYHQNKILFKGLSLDDQKAAFVYVNAKNDSVYIGLITNIAKSSADYLKPFGDDPLASIVDVGDFQFSTDNNLFAFVTLHHMDSQSNYKYSVNIGDIAHEKFITYLKRDDGFYQYVVNGNNEPLGLSLEKITSLYDKIWSLKFSPNNQTISYGVLSGDKLIWVSESVNDYFRQNSRLK